MDDLLTQMLTFHHVGCVVKNLEQAIEAYRPIARGIGEIRYIESQKIRVSFVEIGPGSYVELIEPAGEDSTVSQLLKSRVTFYHIGFLVRDFDAALEALQDKRYMHLSTFRSEAFGMRRCAFLACPVAHLIEIVEQG
jgi:methylmalonyl-CoA/ethylmalonyl-CoA epimerase